MEERCLKMNEDLGPANYEFLFNEPNSFETSASGTVDCKRPILVKCLKCGKISREYYQNIRIGHKKCNCNETKKFTRNFSVEDFIKKWNPLNRKNFTLLDKEYVNRNTIYHVKCNKCGKEDTRWGITLIDGPTHCKYCESLSIGEELVSSILQELGIDYQREYCITIGDHYHRFDFFLPKYNAFIEYNGPQHYEAVPYFGGEEKYQERVERDNEKKEYCERNNIPLLIIKYTSSYEEIKTKIGSMFNDYPARE